MLITALTTLAIVTQDQSALRAAPRESAPQQAVLWQGDSLEIRGQKGDYLQVYDHRRERSGYIRATQVRQQSLAPEAAPELLAIVRFLHDTPGAEALGIGYTAAYLQAAPAQAINGETFEALGHLAERLADRASSKRGQTGAAGQTIAAHLEVAAHYGVRMNSYEREGQVRLCYDGEAYRRVMALPASDSQKAVAALALTRHDCVAPTMPPGERFALDNWRIDVLQRVNRSELPEVLKNRLRLREAGVWASLAHQRARRPEPGQPAVQAAGEQALQALASINKAELAESDASVYNDAALRVGASRWAVEPVPSASTAPTTAATTLAVALRPGEPGQTCVDLVDAQHSVKNPLISRCTYGVVWAASASANPQGTALALAVQPLESWREMWVFQQGEKGWHVDVLPPGADNPELGYIEFAGWVPKSPHMLAAREIRSEGRYQQSFELLRMGSLEVEKKADKPASLSTFYRWQDPAWKAQTVSVR